MYLHAVTEQTRTDTKPLNEEDDQISVRVLDRSEFIINHFDIVKIPQQLTLTHAHLSVAVDSS